MRVTMPVSVLCMYRGREGVMARASPFGMVGITTLLFA